MSHNTANANGDRPKPMCHLCKKPGHYRNQCRLLKRQKEQSENNQNDPGSKNSGANNSIPNKNTNKNNNNSETVTDLKESQKLFIHPVRNLGRQTTPQRNATMEPTQPLDRLLGTEDWKDRIRSKEEPIKMTRMKLLRLQPKI